MPSYYYRARDLSGRAHEGVQVAASEDEVLRTLDGMKLVPVLIESRTPRTASTSTEWTRQLTDMLERWRGRIKPASVALFARQIDKIARAVGGESQAGTARV